MKKILAMAMLVTMIACGGDNDTGDKVTFDQKPMLENLGNNIIVPAFETLSIETKALKDSVTKLLASPTQEMLDNTRIALKEARLAWQACLPYQFGPAQQNRMLGGLAIYPLDVTRVESKISANDTDVTGFSNEDARGFQAVGYFIHGNGQDDASILTALTGTRAAYLQAVVNLIHGVSNKTFNDWKMGFLNNFTSSLGTSRGSSFAQFYQANIQIFERFVRDGKVGLPAGIFPNAGNGPTKPINAEAYYAGYSVELLMAALQAYELSYTGGEGTGLQEVLVGLEATELAEATTAQYTTLIEEAGKLSDPLTDQIANDLDPMETLFNEMQELIRLYKADINSTVGISLESDNDGD